jgi:hypothetical protein
MIDPHPHSPHIKCTKDAMKKEEKRDDVDPTLKNDRSRQNTGWTAGLQPINQATLLKHDGSD